jgi:hypothetical protein
MALPQIVTPEYTLKLFSLAKPITFRPYLVKEEKLLLMAQQGGTPTEVESAVRQIVRNCTNGTVNVDTLPPFDLEYMFLQLRGKSVNNLIESQYECQNLVEGKRCGTFVPININIDDIKLVVPEGHTNRVMLSDELGVILKYPTVSGITDTNADIVSILAGCLSQIFKTSGEVWEVSEESTEDVQNFIETLTVSQVDKFRPFFETMPKLSHTFTFKCSKCGYTEDITLHGLMDFFG